MIRHFLVALVVAVTTSCDSALLWPVQPPADIDTQFLPRWAINHLEESLPLVTEPVLTLGGQEGYIKTAVSEEEFLIGVAYYYPDGTALVVITERSYPCLTARLLAGAVDGETPDCPNTGL